MENQSSGIVFSCGRALCIHALPNAEARIFAHAQNYAKAFLIPEKMLF
jgi:hypothetical protein